MAIEKVILTKLTLDSKSFSSNISKSKQDIIKLSAAAAGISAIFGKIALSTAKYQDSIVKAARATGSTAEEFSVFNHAAELAGVSMDTLRGGLIKLTKPSEAAQKTLKQLGVTLRDSQGNLKNQSQILGDIADGFKKIESPQKRTAAAFTLFEEAGTRMVNVLKDGSAGLRAMRNEAEALGIVVSQEAAESAELFNDNIAKLSKAFQGLSNTIGTSIIEFVNQSGIMEAITDTIKEIIKWWNSLDKSTKDIIVTIVGVIAAFTAVAGVLAGIIAIAPAVKAAFTAMTGPIGIVITAVAGLATAFTYLSNSRKRFIEQAEKESQQLQHLINEYDELANKKNLTTHEAERLRVAQKNLEQAARASGVAFDLENSSLKDQVDILRELKAMRDAETKSKLAEIEAELKIQKEVFKTLQEEKKLGNTISGATAKFLTDVEFFADTGVGLLVNVNHALKIAGKRLITLDTQASKLKASLNPVVKETKKMNRSFVRFNRTAKKTKKQIQEMTDFLRNNFQKTIISINKDYEKFIKSVKADKKISKEFADVLIAEAGKKRVELVKQALEKEKQVVMGFNNEVLNLEKSRLAEEKRLALESLDNLYTEQAITIEQYNKQRLEIEKSFQSKLKESNIKAFTGSIGKVVGSANVLVGAMRNVTDVIVSGMKQRQAEMERDFEVMFAQFTENAQREIELTEQAEQEKIDRIKESYDSQIRAIEEAEQEKYSILEGASNERLLLLNEEFQEAKRLAEEKFQQDLERERLKFEMDKELLLEKALDKEQRQLTETLLDEDFRLLVESLEAQHQDRMNQMSKDFANKQKEETNNLKESIKAMEVTSKDELKELIEKRDAELLAAEEAKNTKLTAMEEAKTKKEKEMQKEQVRQVWEAEKAQFEATKVVKITEIIASTISAAAQAFAALAPIPFVGPVLGGIAAAAIIAAGTASVAQLAGQEPIKPAALSLQKGGVLAGDQSHAKGGIPAELESGEAVIDKVRTEKLIEAVDSNSGNTNGLILTFNFEKGSIVTSDSILNDETIEEFTLLVARRMEREGFAT